MTIFNSAYDTTACEGFKQGISKITSAIEAVWIQQSEITPLEGTHILPIHGGDQTDLTIKQFIHPVYFQNKNETYIAQDMRSFVTKSPTGDYRIRDKTEYDSNLLRSQLLYQWLTKNKDRLKDLGTFPMKAYVQWISESITKRLALEPREQLALMILSGIFYLNNFKTDSEAEEFDKNVTTMILVRELRLPADFVYDVVQRFSVIGNVAAFCQAAKDLTQNVRLNDLNPTTLFTIVGSYWYGNNGRELICVALEHPPTWFALVYQACNDRGYKNTLLSKLLDRSPFKQAKPLYVQQIKHFVQIEFE